MVANARRGEVAAILDGREMRLRLTLGALVARFSTGKLSATDMMRIVGAGLRGAGTVVTDEEVGRMDCDDGAAGFARIVSELLAQTFGRAGEGAPQNP